MRDAASGTSSRPPGQGGPHPLRLLEGRWTLQLLTAFLDGPRRFSDLRAALGGVSANILTVRLRDLEAAGLVNRAYLAPPAASHVYELTDLAESLRPALSHLAAWRGAPSPVLASEPKENVA